MVFSIFVKFQITPCTTENEIRMDVLLPYKSVVIRNGTTHNIVDNAALIIFNLESRMVCCC